MTRVLVIAEAGVNHNGDLDTALALVDAAKAAEADVVKFQTFKAESLVTGRAQQAGYQAVNTGRAESQLEMLRRLELTQEMHHRLVERCAEVGIAFLSTAFDPESLDFLAGELAQPLLKLSSGDLTNLPFVLQHARTGRDLIVSTGMANLSDVEAALGAVAFGLIADPADVPGLSAFAAAYSSSEGQAALKEKVTLLHCTSEYPAPPEDVNLTAMRAMHEAFGLRVGYSDHTAGIAVPIAAAALGACVVEKHFTLDRDLPGPDHRASLEPGDLVAMVAGIREIESALGDGVKRPRPSELRNVVAGRKSLVAARPIEAGQTIAAGDIAIKRPGDGLAPARYWEVVGGTARRDYAEGEPLDG